MCRKQPGRRCPTHCNAKLVSALAALERVRDNPDADEAAVQAAEDDARLAATDVDTTGTGRNQLLERISELEGHDGPEIDARRRALVTRLVAAQALSDEWTRQKTLMPDPPDSSDTEGRKLHDRLGQARGSMARLQVQMFLARNSRPDCERWAARHRAAASEALRQHTLLRMRAAGGQPDSNFLSPAEKESLRSNKTGMAGLAFVSHQRAVQGENPGAFDTDLPAADADGDGDSDAPRAAARPAVTRNQRRAATMRAASLRELRQVVARAKAFDDKLAKGSGKTAFDLGGLFMLDFFTRAVR